MTYPKAPSEAIIFVKQWVAIFLRQGLLAFPQHGTTFAKYYFQENKMVMTCFGKK
jgi:hypothetical protein